MLERARANHAPERVTQVLERLKKKQFQDMPDLIERSPTDAPSSRRPPACSRTFVQVAT